MSNVKHFVLGTEWNEATANSLLSFAMEGLRRQAGYIPPTLPDDMQIPCVEVFKRNWNTEFIMGHRLHISCEEDATGLWLVHYFNDIFPDNLIPDGQSIRGWVEEIKQGTGNPKRDAKR